LNQERNESPDEYFEKALARVRADIKKYPDSQKLAKYEQMFLALQSLKFSEAMALIRQARSIHSGSIALAKFEEKIAELQKFHESHADGIVEQVKQASPGVSAEYAAALEGALKAVVPEKIYAEAMAEPDPKTRCGLLIRLYNERFIGPLRKEAEEIKKTRAFAKDSSEENAHLKEKVEGLEKALEENALAAESLAAYKQGVFDLWSMLPPIEDASASQQVGQQGSYLATLLQEGQQPQSDTKDISFDDLKAAVGKVLQQIAYHKKGRTDLDERIKVLTQEKKDAEKKVRDTETVTGFAQQLQEQQVLKAQEDARVAQELKSILEERYNALEGQHKATLADLRHSQKLLDKQQEALDAITCERDKAQKELTVLSCSEKLQKYHAELMNQLKTQPVFINLLLKVAEATGKTRQDLSDPSKTTDLSENLDWLMMHLVEDILPNAHDWDSKEIKLEGAASIAKVSLAKVLDVIKTYIPENERSLFEQRIQESKQAEDAIQAAKGADKSQLEKPESISNIVSGMMRFANLQWHLDNELLAEAVFGSEKAEEYIAIKDPQKRAEWVQKSIEEFKEQYNKAAEAMADRKAADALAAKEGAESQRDASQQRLAEVELSYKEKLIDLFALFPREIEADATEGILAKMLINEKGPKGDTQDISVDNLKKTIEQTLAQRADYKQRAADAEESEQKAREELNAKDAELRQKGEYLAKIEESKSNLGQIIGEQAAKLQELAGQIGQKDVELYEKENALERLNEKIKKLESGEGFKLTDFVSKADHDDAIRKKEEELALLKKTADGHISKNEYEAGIKAKEDEVRGEYQPEVLDQKKQIADLKSRISELEKEIAEKSPGVLAAAFTDDATANELAGLRQQLEAAKANVYNPDVHMPKAEHDAALAAKEAELRDEYKPAVDRKDELERIATEQKATLGEKEGKIIQLQQRLETAEAAKTAVEARLAGTQAYDPEKHVTKEDYQAALAQKDEQLRGKQGEVDALSQAKSAAESMFAAARAGALNPVDYILKSDYEKALADVKAASAEEKRIALAQKETELAVAKANVYDSVVHMPKAEHAVALAAKEAELRDEYKPAVDERDALKGDKSRLEEKARAQEAAIRQEKAKSDQLNAELAAVRAGALNPADYVPKSDYEKALADAKAASAEEKRAALEQKDAEAKQRVDEKQNRITELEGIVQGKTAELDTAKANVYTAAVHMPKADHERVLAEAKAAADNEKQNALAEQERSYKASLAEAQSRLDAANANVYNPDKHMTKEDHQQVLDAANKNYASKVEQVKARIKELEVQVAVAQQKISECKDESLQQLMNAADMAARLLKENRGLYAKLNPK
jgi:colicin import membrane protein